MVEYIYIYNEYNTHIHIHMIDCNSNFPFVLDVKCFIYHSYTIYLYVLPFIVSICPCCISYICFSNNKNLTFIIKQVTLTCAIYTFLLMKCKGCDIVHMHGFQRYLNVGSRLETKLQRINTFGNIFTFR